MASKSVPKHSATRKSTLERLNTAMSSHAWIITHVNTKELGVEMGTEVGIMGPSDAPPEALEAVMAGKGVTFRMLDDDGIWYYRGKLWFPGINEPGLSKYSEPE